MRAGLKPHRLGGGAAFLTLLALLGAQVPSAGAAGAPQISEAWASAIFSSSARLQAAVNPNGASTTYHFEYIAKNAYDSNIANSQDPFAGAARMPAASDSSIGGGGSAVNVLQLLSGLTPDTTYYYRVAAKNSFTSPNYVYGPLPTQHFNTQSSGSGAVLADSRGWEMVTPVDKNGGRAGAPEEIADGGVLQAAAAGGGISYSSEASFAGGGAGAPPASQYIASRDAAGWSSENISPPLFSGSYDSGQVGVPFQIFSGDLARAILLNGAHCRGDVSGCAVANPPLAGTGAPEGFQDYYLRDNADGGYRALLGAANSAFLTLEPAEFDLTLAGTAPDLEHGVLSTCAALTATASEVPLGEGCDPAQQNLYEYGPGALTLVNPTPGASLAAQSGAISTDGSRVYWSDPSGDIFLHQGGADDAVGSGDFQIASADGAFAFYIDSSGHLRRYDAVGHASTDLTPSGGVTGVLGASTAGDHVYYQDGSALKLWHSGATTTVAVGPGTAEARNFLPDGGNPLAEGTARVSPDGAHLLFVSSAPLTGYDNKDLKSGSPDAEAYLYETTGGGSLICVSCNPSNGRPVGSARIPGVLANGSLAGSTRVYRPRSLSANGSRVFFDSDDTLVLTDTDGNTDAYQWEAQGEGSCARAGGCISLISSGRAAGGAHFVDASADGADAFFLTEGSLVVSDPGGADLYDARVGGGFPVPVPPIPCQGDACQSLPPEPTDPTLTTLLTGPGNPGVRYPKQRHRCKKGRVRRKGKCVKKRSGSERGRAAR